jgi:hypothetical protein
MVGPEDGAEKDRASEMTRSESGLRVETPSPSPSPTPASGTDKVVRARFAPGTILANRYSIVRFIAEGGMGSVYEAVDQELREHVALKMVLPEISADP